MKIAVLIGGSGRTLKNFVELGLPVKLVIGHKHGLGGYQYFPHHIICQPSDEIFDYCRRYGINLVCMAGWIKFLNIPEDFINRVMNIHPSLLPAFGGKGFFGHHVHEAVLESGTKFSGCTVHFADNEYDHGPIITQRLVPVLDDDTPDALAARIFAEELIAYPEAIKLFTEGKLKVRGRRVVEQI
jgi:folate-dependent phosphoribosylglycinamide formyltransferase PurN